MSDNRELIYANGVNADTGTYGFEALPPERFLNEVILNSQAPDNEGELNNRGQAGYAVDVDPKDLSKCGWGIVFGHNADPQVREALKPLLALRQKQAGDLYQEYFDRRRAFRVGRDDRDKFMERHKVSKGIAEPAEMPYYLLIVGNPDDLPYRFQYQMDIQRAVGRLDFGNDYDAYERYARSVVEVETGNWQLPRRAAFFGVENLNDRSTELSTRNLIAPLLERFSNEQKDWQWDSFLAEAATRRRLETLLGGSETPSLLFTASHGLEFERGDARQEKHQGALLCSDWQGPGSGKIGEDLYFAGDHLAGDTNLGGLLAFFFACYGAGTPIFDEFSKQALSSTRAQIAERNFIAALPRQMLSLRGGAALAVVGHVERAWSTSFLSGRGESQVNTYRRFINKLLDGFPVGHAMEDFNLRYAELASDLSLFLEGVEFGDYDDDPYEAAARWTSTNDARGYVILGDPAVRLPVAAPPTAGASQRPAIDMTRPIDLSAYSYVPPQLQQAEDGRPESIDAADWASTPDSVKLYIKDLLDDLRSA